MDRMIFERLRPLILPDLPSRIAEINANEGDLSKSSPDFLKKFHRLFCLDPFSSGISN
ncbi:MAG: hypothetical protein WCE61_13575 [Candidatus Acidiferrum sp.]